MSYNGILAFLFSFAAALALTPFIRRGALKYHWVKKPKQDRWGGKYTASFGGISIFIAYTACVLFFAGINKALLVLLLGAGGIFLLGLFDDIFGIKPPAKLAIEIAAAAALVYFGFRVELVPFPIIGIPLTILWIVGITNAFNLLDNMDGLSAGTAFIAAGFFTFCAALNGDTQVVVLSSSLAGASLGFLRYNFNPAKIFMGDCGSLFLGFTLAVIALLGTWRFHADLVMVMLASILVLAVPIFDTTFVTFLRKLSGRAISEGGKDHVSHHLVFMGLSERKAVLFLYLLSVIFGIVGVLATRLNFSAVMVAISLTFSVLFFFGIYLGGNRIYQSVRSEPSRAAGAPAFEYKRYIFELLIDSLLICVSYVSAYLLRFEGLLSEGNQLLIVRSLPVMVILKSASFFYFGLYRGIWRYVGISDLLNIFKAVSVGSIASALYVLLAFRFEGYSRSVFVIDWLLLLILISGVRILERVFRELLSSMVSRDKKVLIYGAGDLGVLTLREIRNNIQLGYRIMGFLDDDSGKLGRKIQGFPVLGTKESLPALARQRGIEEVIMALPLSKIDESQAMAAFCESVGIRCRSAAEILPL